MKKETLVVPNDGISVVSISDPDNLIGAEIGRVRWYLDKYPTYVAQGYQLRFPKGINPDNRDGITDQDIRTAIMGEFNTDLSDYQDYARQFEEAWIPIAEKLVPVAKTVYGFSPVGRFEIIPTAYGTGGGQLVMDGPVFCRLPKYRGGGFRTEREFIVHEILAHGATAKLRNDTVIDESNPKCTHQWHKERLMDLLGRTFLIRSGLMGRDDIRMQDKALEVAGTDVDPLYYKNHLTPDDNMLNYEGRFGDLVRELDTKLRSK